MPELLVPHEDLSEQKPLNIGQIIQMKFQTEVNTKQNTFKPTNQNQRSLVMHKVLFFLKLCLFLLLVSLSSKANTCLPDAEGLCTPGVTVDEQVTVEKTEE